MQVKLGGQRIWKMLPSPAKMDQVKRTRDLAEVTPTLSVLNTKFLQETELRMASPYSGVDGYHNLNFFTRALCHGNGETILPPYLPILRNNRMIRPHDTVDVDPAFTFFLGCQRK